MLKLKHGWNSFPDYINVHEKLLRRNESFMLVPKKYEIVKITDNYWTLMAKGIIFRTFKNREVRVDILKDIEVDITNRFRPMARTEAYTYSANYPTASSPLIRYCSPHHDVDPAKAPDHHRFHHKHDFLSGKEVITKLEQDDWPHVSEFILEVLKNF